MSFVPLAKDSFPNYALVLASEEQPLQELLPRHLAETPAADPLALIFPTTLSRLESDWMKL